jgi:hypothetical protein
MGKRKFWYVVGANAGMGTMNLVHHFSYTWLLNYWLLSCRTMNMPVSTLLHLTLLITSVRWLLIIIQQHHMYWTSWNTLVSFFITKCMHLSTSMPLAHLLMFFCLLVSSSQIQPLMNSTDLFRTTLVLQVISVQFWTWHYATRNIHSMMEVLPPVLIYFF